MKAVLHTLIKIKLPKLIAGRKDFEGAFVDEPTNRQAGATLIQVIQVLEPGFRI